MPKSKKLQDLMKRKRGKVSSAFRDSIDNDRVYKELGLPVNKNSYHQLQGGAFDKIVKTRAEAEELSNELKDNNFFSYTKKARKGYMVHGDIGPYSSKEERQKEFKKLYKDQTTAKGQYLFGNPSMNRQTEERIPFPRPEEEEKVQRAIANIQAEQIQQKAVEAEQTMQGAAAIATDEDIKAKVAKVSENLPYQVKQKVKDDLSNGNKVIENVTSSISKKEQGQEPSLKESFFEAVSFFLPNMIGLVAGSAIAGTEGAIAGEERAGQLATGFREYKLKREELRQRSLKQSVKDVDVTSFTDASTGKPVRYNPADQSFTDISGNPIDMKNIVQTNVYKQGRSLEQKNQESQRKASQFAQKFGFDKKKAGQLSDNQIEELGSLSDTEVAIGRIRSIKDQVNTGPLASQLQAGAKLVDLAPEKFVELQTEVGSMVNNYIKAITGAQMSEPEAQRIKSVAPDINDNDKTFMIKLRAFERIVVSRKKVIAEAIASGQPLKKEVVRQMVKEVEDTLKKLPSKKGASSGELRRRTKDGKIAIFDAETKKFLRYE